MLHHVVLMSFDEDAGEDHLRSVVEALHELPSLVPGIEEYRVGTDLGLAEGNARLCVVATFRDEDAWATYRDHPAHRRVIEELIAPHLVARNAVQTRF